MGENINEINIQDELINVTLNVDYYPLSLVENGSLEKHAKLPFANISAIGTAFEPLSAIFQNVIKGKNGNVTNLYRVTVPPGSHLAPRTDGTGLLGTVLKNSNNQITGQATLTPVNPATSVVVCNPAMLFMAAAIISINVKLDEIQEMQKEIFKFLERKERATLRGNLNFLTEVLNNYKHNWNNEKYKNSNYIKVLDIKQEAERSILFYKDQISDKINKDVSNILDKQLENLSTKIQSDFREYQLSLYIYAFSSFLDVMLLENFKSDYIEGVVSKIKDKTFEYLKLYTQCYEKIDEKFNTSIQSAITNQLAKAKKYINENTKINTIINKIPISKSLSYSIDLFDKLDSTKEQAMSSFREIKDVIVRPFIDKLTTINKLYNQPFDVIFDKDNMYFNLEP